MILMLTMDAIKIVVKDAIKFTIYTKTDGGINAY